MKIIHAINPLAVVAVLLLGIAACTHDEQSSSTDGAELTPVVIRATGLPTGGLPVSRATVDGDWQGVASVALRIGEEVKVYTVVASDVDGYKNATLSNATDPFYWMGYDKITATAWWPYNETDLTQMPAVKVKADQSDWDAFAASDFISAEEQTVEHNNPTLEFTYRTARVAVSLTNGDGITDDDISHATVSLTGLSTTDGNPATIDTYNASGFYEALVLPQTVTAGTPFIEVKLDGVTFYFRPKDDVVLVAGNRYTYAVNVNATGLTLGGCTIGGWEPGNGESGSAEDLGYTYDSNTKTYSVYAPDGLLAWAEAVQSDHSINCTLTSDIDMTGKVWTPIGRGDISANGFQGTFDGQGHRIMGLTITTDNSSGEAAALFDGIGGNGEVKNLQLVNVNYEVKPFGVAGGIAGSNFGTITVCSVMGTIASNGGNVGGITGSNFGTITACWFKGTITGNATGGIANTNFGNITACYWGGNATVGVDYNDYGGTRDPQKLGDNDSWVHAINGMNPALTGNSYRWTLGTDGLPVLTKQ